MNPIDDAFLRSWPFDPWLTLALLVTAAIYARGWLLLRRRDAQRWHAGQLAAFLTALAVLFVALASPIEPFASLLLCVHMVQHLLLTMVVAPLVWLAAPQFPLFCGLPAALRRDFVGVLLGSPEVRRMGHWLARPAMALALFVAATWLWHLPPLYELALRSSGWHYLQHACFLLAALAFWYPVVRPYPARPRWSPWLLLPYLLVADVQNTALSALLTFSPQVLYPHYAQGPRLAGLSALDDQVVAGVLMWVPGSIVFLVPLFWIAVRLLAGTAARPKAAGPRTVESLPRYVPLNVLQSASSAASRRSPARPRRFDLLALPFVGPFLRWRHARLCLQVPLGLLAGVVILDGLTGPQLAPLNLAGVLPWIHWRGLLVLGLLVAGNFFCLACPFLLPRTLARRWLPAGREWPRRLRNKWLAVGLLAVFLWAYEAFSLWDSPWLTAWIAVSYFVAALVVDGFFRGAAFCKYVCPIGQFNFVQSLVSPLEVSVREPALCTTCTTKDCIRGTAAGLPGCELGLFQPRKAGNMDCTFCLDCAHACPHDNVGLIAGLPGRNLWQDRFRSGVGRFSRRPDLAALVLVLVFGALANAAGMVGPVLTWQDRLQAALGLTARWQIVSLSYFAALVVLPLVLVGGASVLGRQLGRVPVSSLRLATRFAITLVPLGAAVWVAHYSFHLLTSYETIVPAAQRFAADHGLEGWGTPHWAAACCRAVGDWLPRAELLVLDLGLLLSLCAGYRASLSLTPRPGLALRLFAPFAVLTLLLFACAVWIVFQPMEMRGTLTTEPRVAGSDR